MNGLFSSVLVGALFTVVACNQDDVKFVVLKKQSPFDDSVVIRDKSHVEVFRKSLSSKKEIGVKFPGKFYLTVFYKSGKSIMYSGNEIYLRDSILAYRIAPLCTQIILG